MNPGDATVLVVDDDPNMLEVVREILEAQGHRVLKAISGEEALRVAEAHPGPIALLVADVVMPGLSGPEVAGRLRATRPGTKVLFMSGFTTEVVFSRGLDPGDPFLVKPFRPDALVRKVQEVLSFRSPFARRPEPPKR
jgi:two-component system cell cycle sensor histidine kinase/response regulator CckA